MEQVYEVRIYEETMSLLYEQQRPSMLLRPKLLLDGNQYCALYGDDLMSGIAGFGDTADAAMRDFDKNWTQSKAPIAEKPVEKLPRHQFEIGPEWEKELGG
jgi:hypothetical protein